MRKDEQLKMELGIRLEEYRALKAEIVSNLDSARQIVTLTLTAVGILISATPIIIQSKVAVIFLIAPLLFYVLAWAQLKYIYLVLDMGTYLRDTIAPNIRRILNDMHTEYEVASIMSWDLKGKGPSRLRDSKPKNMFFLPIAVADYGVALLAALLSVAIYLVLTYQSTKQLSPVEILFIAVQTVIFAYSAYWGFEAERRR
jgi:hypothetical protein